MDYIGVRPIISAGAGPLECAYDFGAVGFVSHELSACSGGAGFPNGFHLFNIAVQVSPEWAPRTISDVFQYAAPGTYTIDIDATMVP